MKIDEFEFRNKQGQEIEPTKNQLVIYIKSLHKEIKELEKALELACKDVHDLTQNQTGVELCYECEHFDLCNKLSNIDKLDLECEQVFAHAYKTKAKEMLENEK